MYDVGKDSLGLEKLTMSNEFVLNLFATQSLGARVERKATCRETDILNAAIDCVHGSHVGWLNKRIFPLNY